MRPLLTAVCGVILLHRSLYADSVSFNIFANDLRDAAGQPMPVTGLVLLVASTNDTVFSGPTSSAFATGDDIVLVKWDLSKYGIPGFLYDSVETPLQLSGGWNVGDPLAIYWFPTLTTNATSPGYGAAYGFYRDTSSGGVDTSYPWVTPSGGGLIDLKFYTTDSGGTNNPPSSANASQIVGGGGGGTNYISGVVTTNAGVLIKFTGSPGNSYVIQATTNLTPPVVWQNLSTNTANAGDGSYQYLEAVSSNYPARFYRSLH